MFQTVAAIHTEPSFQWGEFDYGVMNANILSYIRQAEGFQGYAVIINFGSDSAHIDLFGTVPDKVPKSGEIVAHTATFSDHGRAKEYAIGTSLDMSSFLLYPTEGIIVRWEWEALP